MSIDTHNIFPNELLKNISIKYSKQYLNTKQKNNTNVFELYKINNKFESDEIQIYDIYINEIEWNNKLSLFLTYKNKKYNHNIFNFKNNFYEKINNDSQYCYKILNQSSKVLNNKHIDYLINSFYKDHQDPSSFSCQDNYLKTSLVEHRIFLSSKAPIYISFIHNITLNKYYIKLWFEIKEDIDIVLEELSLIT